MCMRHADVRDLPQFLVDLGRLAVQASKLALEGVAFDHFHGDKQLAVGAQGDVFRLQVPSWLERSAHKFNNKHQIRLK